MVAGKIQPQRVVWVALLIALIGSIVLHAPLFADAPPPLSDAIWSVGEVGNGTGPAGLLIADINDDGQNETVACSSDSPFLYRVTPENATRYDPVWYGERVACSALALGDANGDGVLELFVGSRTPAIYVYRYNTTRHQFERTARLSLPGAEGVTDLETGDVDGDGLLELIVTRLSDTTIYDAETFAVEWAANGVGGTTVKIGNVIGDPESEIIVNGATGYVLSAVNQSIVFTKADGWGQVIDVGDSNGDGYAEIAYIRGDTVSARWVGVDKIENGTVQRVWEIGPAYAEWVAFGQVESGVAGGEVVVGGTGSGDGIAVRDGGNGNLLWTISNPGAGVQGMGVGDSNHDGIAEIWWGSGQTSAASDQVLVADSANRAITWRNRDYEGPFFTAAGDIDTDGTVELVALSTTFNDGTLGGVYLPYDGVTRGEELTRTTQVVASAFVLGQVDEDAVLEMVIGGQFHGSLSAYVEVIDSTTRQTQWTRSNLGTGAVAALKTANIDQDLREEIFIAAPNRRVYVHDGASNSTEWEAGPFASDIVDLEIADADGDNILELAVLTQEQLYIYSTASWTLNTTIPIDQDGFRGSQAAAGNEDGTGSGEWVIASVRPLTGSIPYESRVQLVEGSSHTQQWETVLPGVTVVELLTQPGHESRAGRLYLGGYQQMGEATEQPTYLTIADYDQLGITERYTNSEFWGNLYAMTLTDANGDGVSELFMGTSTLYQFRSTEAMEPTAVRVTRLQGNPPAPLPPVMIGMAGLAILMSIILRIVTPIRCKQYPAHLHPKGQRDW